MHEQLRREHADVPDLAPAVSGEGLTAKELAAVEACLRAHLYQQMAAVNKTLAMLGSTYRFEAKWAPQ